MEILERLKMELSNQQYFSNEQYKQFLVENDLLPTDDYDKGIHQRQLLLTVLDVLEAVSNDLDIMQSITTEFSTTGAAYKYIEQRIAQVKDKIATIPDPAAVEEYSCFSLMFTRDDNRNYTPTTYGARIITNDEIDSIMDE